MDEQVRLRSSASRQYRLPEHHTDEQVRLRSSASRQYRHSEQLINDGLPNLHTFDSTPQVSVEAIVAETAVPLMTLRAWERNYGIPSPWSGEDKPKLYSARDVAAVRWISRQVISRVSVKQAVVELVHLEYEYATSQSRQAAEMQLPYRYELAELRDKMMQSVVVTSRSSAARILANAFATYPARQVCLQLLQPVLAYTLELRGRGVLPPAAETFARTLVHLAYPYLIESCISPEEASRYLTLLAGIPDIRESERRRLSVPEASEIEEMLVGAISCGDGAAAQHLLDRTFHSYSVEDVCANLLHPVLSRLDMLTRENKISAAAGHLGISLLQKRLFTLFQSTPNLDRDLSILVGCTPQEISEIDALMLALFWRRAGLQVHYVGQVDDTEVFIQQVQAMRPALVYLSTASRMSIHQVAEMGREMAGPGEHRPTLCFGGAAFDQAPNLIQSITGVYLGAKPEVATRNLQELVRLYPTLSPGQIREMIAPSSLLASSQSQSTPNPGRGLSILVGCTPQQASEVNAFMLALSWRRVGLQVHYVGQVDDTEVFIQQVQATRPALVYLSTASRMSIHRVAQVGREMDRLTEHRPMLCFGGAAFDQAPNLIRSITGVYLGSKPEVATRNLQELIRLYPTLSPGQIQELMAPNSLLTSFQREMVAANTSMTLNEFAGDRTTAVAEIPGGDASAPAFSQQQAAESTKGLQTSPEKSVGWRGTIFYPGWADVQKALPGLFLLVLPIALLSEVIWLIEIHLHATFFVDIFIAGVLALIAANMFTLPEWVQGGLTFSTRWFLRLGIICYALKFSYQPLLQSGLQNLVIVTSTVATALGVSVLVGKLLKLNPHIAALIGVGTGICGISATIVTSPAIGARDEDTAVTLGTILCWGTTGLLLYPLVSGLVHLSPVVYGAWTGATIHDLPQLIAAAQQGGGSAALKAALFVKLVRVAFIVVLVFFLSVFFGVKERLRDGAQGKRGNVVIEALKAFPLFVFGFFLVVLINTVATVPGWLAGPLATWPVTTFPTTVSSVLLMLAIIGICARVNRSAVKIAGVKALLLGGISWVTQSIVVLVVAFLLLH